MSKTAIKDMVELPDISIHFIAIGPGTNKELYISKVRALITGTLTFFLM